MWVKVRALIGGWSPFNFNLNLARRDGQRQSGLSSLCQAFFNCFTNVPFRLGFCPSLADAAGDRRAFSDIPAIFILKQGNKKSLSFMPPAEIHQLKKPVDVIGDLVIQLFWWENENV